MNWILYPKTSPPKKNYYKFFTWNWTTIQSTCSFQFSFWQTYLGYVWWLWFSVTMRFFYLMKVNEGNEEEPGRPAGEVSTGCLASEKGDKSSGSPEDPEKLPIAKPNNAYEFGQIINALSTRKDKEACAHLLAITAPKDLPMLLSNKLEGDTFLLLIQSLKNNLIEKDPSLVYQHLLYLSKAERFKVSG